MREEPPRELSDLLERLDLATPDQVGRVRRRAARLAKQLPLFASVWVDAHVQVRLLSPFQAAEINAGRGESLAVGPYVLCLPLTPLGYAQCYQARQRGTQRFVRLAVADCPPDEAEARREQFDALAALREPLHLPHLALVEQAGIDGHRIWAASRLVTGQTAADWMVSNGRFPPQVVLEIARQMLIGLVALEQVGLCHGDLGAATVTLTNRGDVVLPQPGLRAIIRPEEGYAFSDLLPEAYDYLAPERIATGSAPDAASDIYACGCVWWHMLAGRPPIPGGDSLAKLRAAQAAEIPEIRRLAPETPPPLAAAISATIQRDPRLRPESMACLAAMLGPPTRTGRMMLARCLHRGGEQPDRWAAPVDAIHRWQQKPLWLAMVGGCLVATAAVAWSMWNPGAANRLVATAGLNQNSIEPSPIALAATPGDDRSPQAFHQKLAAPDAERKLPHPDRAAATPPGTPPPPNGAAAGRTANPPKRLVLPADGAVAIDPKALLPNQSIGGASGARTLVAIPLAGLALAQENLRFENVDFVWESPAPGTSADRPVAMIHLQASRVEFRGCSFCTSRPESPLPAAICWTYPVNAGKAELSLPSGQVSVSDCVFRHVAAGVLCRTQGALVLSVANTLYLGRGPMLQFARWPQIDEPMVIRLSGVTLRESGPLVEGTWSSTNQEPGSVTVVANGCTFAPANGVALVSLLGTGSPEKVLANLEWSGQGSLVAPQTSIARWQDSDGRTHVLDDGSISIAGLVRSTVEFAGPEEAGPNASQVVRWQVPLQSSSAPGVDPSRLAEPRR